MTVRALQFAVAIAFAMSAIGQASAADPPKPHLPGGSASAPAIDLASLMLIPDDLDIPDVEYGSTAQPAFDDIDAEFTQAFADLPAQQQQFEPAAYTAHAAAAMSAPEQELTAGVVEVGHQDERSVGGAVAGESRGELEQLVPEARGDLHPDVRPPHPEIVARGVVAACRGLCVGHPCHETAGRGV